MTIVLIVLAVLSVLAVLEIRRHRAPAVEASMMSFGSVRGGAFALARIEGPKLLIHPAFLAGLALFAVGAWAITGGSIVVMHDREATFTLFFFPLAGMTIIATNLAALRSRRDGADEMFDTMPVSRGSRTGAHILTALWAVGVALVFLAAEIAVAYARGAISSPAVFDILTGPVLVGCAAIVGVAAARLIPSALVGPIAIVLMGVFQGVVDHFSGSFEHAGNWFAPLVVDAEFFPSGDLLPRHDVAHLAYVIGLGGLAAVICFVRVRRDRRFAAALAVVAIVIGGASIAQARPYTNAELDRAANYVAFPERVQSCRGDEAARYCAYPGYEEIIPRWSRVVAAVRRSIPNPSPVVLRQRVRELAVASLPPAIRRRLPDGTPAAKGAAWKEDGEIHMGPGWCQSSGSCDFALGTGVAGRLVGLPSTPSGFLYDLNDAFAQPAVEHPYDSSGQARAVIAMWIGARVSPQARSHFLARYSRMEKGPAIAGDVNTRAGMFTLLGCEGLLETGTEFSSVDAGYVAALLRLPDERVAQAIRSSWTHLTDPRTRVEEMVKMFDLGAARAPGLYENC